MQGNPETGGPVGWGLGFTAFWVLPEGRDVSQVQTEVSWEGEVSPWWLTTFWDLLQSVLQSPLSMAALTAVRDKNDKVCSVTVTVSCWWDDEGARSIRADHERGVRGDRDSRLFSSPSEAFVVWWTLGEKKQTWQVSLKCKAQTQARE
jgi:hypothetical protein